MSDTYPPIGDYGYIADCHSAALVSRHGSIDWCCMPRIDSRSCFARLLGWETGGYCQISPLPANLPPRGSYLENTLILETTFKHRRGQGQAARFFPHAGGGGAPPLQADPAHRGGVGGLSRASGRRVAPPGLRGHQTLDQKRTAGDSFVPSVDRTACSSREIFHWR